MLELRARINNLKRTIKTIFYPSPRAGRAEYFAGLLQGFVLLVGGSWGLGAVSLLIPPQIPEHLGILLLIIVMCAFLLIVLRILFLSARRVHDLGYSAFFILLLGVPYLNLIIVLFLIIKKGTPHKNKYGEYTAWEIEPVATPKTRTRTKLL